MEFKLFEIPIAQYLKPSLLEPKITIPESRYDPTTNTVTFYPPRPKVEKFAPIEMGKSKTDETEKIMKRLYELEERLK